MTIWKNTCGESWQDTIENGWEVSGKPGAFLFFIPKGALTHHLLKQAVVALPLVGHVRSPRGIAGFHFGTPCSWGGNIPPHPAACLRKPATGSFVADTGAEQFDSTPVWLDVVIHDALFEKRGEQLQYPFRKDKVIYGDLSFGGQDGQPGRGTLRRGRFGLNRHRCA